MQFYSNVAFFSNRMRFFGWFRRPKFFPFFSVFSLRCTRCQQWVSSRFVGGTSAGRFAALNLTYYLLNATRRLGGHQTTLGYTTGRAYSGERKKNGEKIWGMVLSATEKTKVPKTACGFYYDRFTYPQIKLEIRTYLEVAWPSPSGIGETRQ